MTSPVYCHAVSNILIISVCWVLSKTIEEGMAVSVCVNVVYFFYGRVVSFIIVVCCDGVDLMGGDAFFL